MSVCARIKYKHSNIGQAEDIFWLNKVMYQLFCIRVCFFFCTAQKEETLQQKKEGRYGPSLFNEKRSGDQVVVQ